MHERPAFVPAVVALALGLSSLAALVAPSAASVAPMPADGASRIVSLSLAADEVLVAIARPDTIAALDEFVDDEASNVREEARAFPGRVHASVEEVLSHAPDLVVLSSWASLELRDALRRAGVRLCEMTPPTRLSEVAANVRTIGAAIGRPAEADALAREAEARIAAVRARTAGRPRVRVLFRSTGGTSPGAGTLAEDVVGAAGGELVTATAGLVGFVPLPAERALGLDVDVVVLDDYRADGRARAIGDDVAVAALARRARVLRLPPHLLMTTSHHVAALVEALADALEERP